MSIMASQIIGNSTVCSTACSGYQQRGHTTKLRIIDLSLVYQWPANTPTKNQWYGKFLKSMYRNLYSVHRLSGAVGTWALAMILREGRRICINTIKLCIFTNDFIYVCYIYRWVWSLKSSRYMFRFHIALDHIRYHKVLWSFLSSAPREIGRLT